MTLCCATCVMDSGVEKLMKLNSGYSVNHACTGNACMYLRSLKAFIAANVVCIKTIFFVERIG